MLPGFEYGSKKMPNIKWMKYGKWTTPLLMDSVISEALSKPHFADFGYDHKFSSFLAIDGEYYVDEKEHKKACEFFELMWGTEGSRFLSQFYALCNPETEKAFAYINTLQKIAVKNLNNKRIILEFRNWIASMQPVIYLNAILIPFQEVFERITKGMLEQFPKNNSALFLTKVVQPKTLSHAIKEEYELLKISNAIRQNKALTKKLLSIANKHFDLLEQKEPRIARAILEHTDKYAWLAAINWVGHVFEVDYFLSRIISILNQNPQKVLKNRAKDWKAKELLIKKRLKEAKTPYSAIFIIDMMRSFLDLKQELWDTVSISGYRAREMLTDIGKRLGLTYNELLQLRPTEIESSLIDNQLISKNYCLSERMRHRATIRVGRGVQIFHGNKAESLRSSLLKEETDRSYMLRGSPCFGGFATGNVRVITTVEELSKMEQGKILVCPMTDPDYMPAIRKAKAIVTDEGGILCHAAIISRELKIPCIVGTKIATKVLKDDDFVEVHADKSIVNIIKEAGNVH